MELQKIVTMVQADCHAEVCLNHTSLSWLKILHTRTGNFDLEALFNSCVYTITREISQPAFVDVKITKMNLKGKKKKEVYEFQLENVIQTSTFALQDMMNMIKKI